MYSVREPRSSADSVYGHRPAKISTGARPMLALCTPWPRAWVPTSVWMRTTWALPVTRAYLSAMEIAVTSDGHVMVLGQLFGRSLLPLMFASRMDGWSDPTLTKHLVIPAWRL